MTALLCAIFFLSGAAALLFETLWFQQAGLVLGNSVWASSLVMAAFMGGLALGNGTAARVGARIASPVRVYALLELVIAVAGVALVYGLPTITPLVARMLQPVIDQVWLQNFIRLALAFALLVIPATAMGATLPLLVKELYGRDPHFGRTLGRLYGWNTLGAVLGAVAGHALLNSWIGIRGSAWLAAGVNLLAALAAGWVWRAGRSQPDPPGVAAESASSDSAHSPAHSPARARWLLGVAALCGAILMALEVVWFRFLQLFIHGTSLTFALMLAVVLAGIGLGGLIGARWLGPRPNTDRVLPLLACASGVVVVVSYAGFGRVAGSLIETSVWQSSVTTVLSLLLMFPSALLSGVLFTMLGHALQREMSGEIRPAGLVTMANTLGAMLGSGLGGFVLLPVFGIELSIQLLALGYGLGAILMWPGGLRPRVAPFALASAALVLVAIWLPMGSMQHYLDHAVARFKKQGATAVIIREGLTETSILLEYRRFQEIGDYRLLTNSYSMSTTNLRARRYMKLFVYWPVAIHPDPKRALLISYGVGATAQALTDTRSLESIDIVDISRDILELSSTIYSNTKSDAKRNPLDDPRVTVYVEDGRHFLETRQQRYDLITGEPPPPKVAGIVSLFTTEYFALVRARLREGGITTYWLPVHGLAEAETKAIIRAFCDVFDDCSLWTGNPLDWILIGTRGVKTPVSLTHFVRQWKDPVVAPELRALGLEQPEQLGALFMGDAEFLQRLTRDTLPLDDDHPGRVGSRVVGPHITRPLYRDWINTETTRARFAASRFIKKLWPSELHQASREFFLWQQVINGYFARSFADVGALLPVLDRLQRDSTLRTLPLWVLGSNDDLQAQARRAEARGVAVAGIARERDLAAMARGDYEATIKSALAPGSGAMKSYLHIYALCRTKRLAQAREALGRIPQAARNARAEKFLAERFDLQLGEFGLRGDEARH